MAHDSGYQDKQSLIDAPYMATSPHLAVGTDAKRSCYLGLSKSDWGQPGSRWTVRPSRASSPVAQPHWRSTSNRFSR